MYPQQNEKTEIHRQQVLHANPNILVHIACISPKVSFCEDCYFNSSCTRHLIWERKYVTFERKKTDAKIMVENVEGHVHDIMGAILDT